VHLHNFLTFFFVTQSCYLQIKRIPDIRELWPASGGLLRENGFCHIKGKGLVTFYYLRPGVKTAKLPYLENEHYFTSQDAMYNFICNHWQDGSWREPVPPPPLNGHWQPMQVSLLKPIYTQQSFDTFFSALCVRTSLPSALLLQIPLWLHVSTYMIGH
jgi:hypothetical protein